jgi:short-subunit dehydrogenase
LKKAIVAGASSGIGAAIAERLVAGGYGVVGVSRRSNAALEGSAAFEHEALDLADLDALPAQAGELARRHADASVLVLSAGRGLFGSLEQMSYESMRSLVELNLLSQVYLCRALLPAMKRRGEGVVVFVASEAAHRPGRRGALYGATKFALRGFAEALRDEAARAGVRVSLVSPGLTRTPFFDELDFAPGEEADNALSPADVADAVWLAVAAPTTSVIDEVRLSPLKHVVRRTGHGGE